MDDFHPRRLCYPMQICPSSLSNLSLHETMVPEANGPKFPQGTVVSPSKWTWIQKENGPKFLWKLWFPKRNGSKFPMEWWFPRGNGPKFPMEWCFPRGNGPKFTHTHTFIEQLLHTFISLELSSSCSFPRGTLSVKFGIYVCQTTIVRGIRLLSDLFFIIFIYI
jgi:hypothetical protein